MKWVVQKYIENPLIINKKKFDIRQWIVVTDWNPLTVWAYQKSYVRFAAKEYCSSNTDRLSHLTNNCVVKNFKENLISKQEEEDDCEEVTFDNIWSCD